MSTLAPFQNYAKRLFALITICLTLMCWITASVYSAKEPPSKLAGISGVQTQTDSIRQYSLATNDIVYNPSDHLIYASLPSNAGSNGNSISAINPATGDITSSVFIGSEPSKLALSDDGHTLYTSLSGAFAIRRFDTVTRIPGQQFTFGLDPHYGAPYYVNDLAVAPGNPNLLAIARIVGNLSPGEGGVAVFDNGVQRPNTGPAGYDGSSNLAFSASASTLYGTGTYSALTTMTINDQGVSVSSTSSLSTGARIKFANGLIYTSAGQIINPNTKTLLGTFPDANARAFVIDTSVGRAYYLTGTSYTVGTLTLKAYDLNTFAQVGSLTISNVTGDASSLVRWGANGLAFRAAGGQLNLIQTSLIPSSEPIPTPTPTPAPTPSPTPVPAFVRQLSLSSNDLIYNAATGKIYASVPSAEGPNGNSITGIDPVAATVGNFAYVGSEPSKLALSDDNQTLYVGLKGASSVRRFNVATQTAGLQFYLSNPANPDNPPVYGTPIEPTDISVMPGNPNTVAVNHGGQTVIYDDGVPRPQRSGYGSYAKFNSPSTVYSGSYPVQKLAVSPTGLTSVSTTNSVTGGSIQVANGLVYASGGNYSRGNVIDPEAGVIKGGFSGVGFYAQMAVDPANNRVFFLIQGNTFATYLVRAFDINTYLPLGDVTIQGVNGTANSLVRWGTNGLAFGTTSGQVYLVQTALVNANDPLPAPTPTPSPTPTPAPVSPSTFVRRLDLPNNDLVYNEATQTIFTSVPSSAGVGRGNTLTQINPQTGAITSSVFVGSEPNKLALSDDGQALYVALNGANAVRRFDVPSQTPGLQFSPDVGLQRPQEMAVVPGSRDSVALTQSTSGVGIFDNGVRRPNGGSGGAYAINTIAFSDSGTSLYGYDNETSGNEFANYTVDSSGARQVSVVRDLIRGGNGLKFKNGRLYTTSGRVLDPEALKVLGTFQGSGALAVDQNLGRAFMLSGNVLSAYDINTFIKIGSVTLLNTGNGTPTRLVRWGANGLAFRTDSYTSGSGNDSKIFLIQSELVSGSTPVPTGLQFGATSYDTSEYYPSASITVIRTGDLSAASTVDYATSDGTANANSDFTATSGTLNFAAGESSKTITIPIIDDTVYEGVETFNLTLSNGTGSGTLLSSDPVPVTIQDNDFAPFITGNNPNIDIPLSGTVDATFSIILTNASTQTVSIDYATANGTATAGQDYIATSGRVTFNPLETVKRITVRVMRDPSNTTNETFFINLSNAVNARGALPRTTGTILNTAPIGSALISEFRFHGLAGANDEFIELSNNTDAPLRVSTADGSSGWALVAADGATRFVIPTGTLIPARGHYLAVNNNADGGYSLGASATGDQTYTADIPGGAGIALFRTANSQSFTSTNLLDAVGFTNNSTSYFRGTPLAQIGTLNGEYSFVRKTSTATNLPVNTNDNAADFIFVSTTGETFGGAVSSTLGSPGPENLAGPVARDSIVPSLVDPLACTGCAPNRFRDGSGNSGTLSIRRKFTNNTGATINTLRFRVFDITTLNSPIINPPQADLRLADSTDVTITTSLGERRTVKGTTLAQTPAQTLGGGLNSSMSVAVPAGGLPNGESLDVQLLMNVVLNGRFRFYINVEALP